MSDTENENLRLRLREAERQILGLNQQHSFLYQFVENLNKEFEKLRGDPFSGPASYDPFPGTDTIRAERDELAEWKRQHKLVDNWWYEIDTYVREHPSTVAGESVAAAALRLLKERDSFARTLKSFSEAAKAIHIKPLDFPCPTS